MAPTETAAAKQRAPAEAQVEKIEQGVIQGWVGANWPCYWVFVNDQPIAKVDLTDAAPAEGDVRRVAFDAHALPPVHLLSEELRFDFRPAASADTAGGAMTTARRAFKTPCIASTSFTDKLLKRPRRVEGCIDEYASGRLRGWIWDSARPFKSLDVDVFIDDCFAGRYPADVFRADLLQLGKGAGLAGFEIDISEFLAAPKRSEKRVLVLSSDPPGWSAPIGAHADVAAGRRPKWFKPPIRTSKEFVAALVHTQAYPKKVFDVHSLTSQKMPDPFSADYTLLAIEFLRREVVEAGERLHEDPDNWRRNMMRLRLLEFQLARLTRMGAAICAGQGLLVTPPIAPPPPKPTEAKA